MLYVEHWAVGAAVFGAFAILVLSMVYGWPLNLVGWCFVVAGLGVTVPRVIAGIIWKPATGLVLEAESHDGGQSIKFRYYFDGDSYLGTFGGTAFKKPGDVVRLFVNPERPTQFFAMGGPLLVLGVFFVFFGILAATSEPIYAAGWN